MTRAKFNEILRRFNYPERLINVMWDEKASQMSEEEIEQRAIQTKEDLGEEIEELRGQYMMEELLNNCNNANSSVN